TSPATAPAFTTTTGAVTGATPAHTAVWGLATTRRSSPGIGPTSARRCTSSPDPAPRAALPGRTASRAARPRLSPPALLVDGAPRQTPRWARADRVVPDRAARTPSHP